MGERHCERVMTHSMLSVQPTASGKLRRLTASHCNSRCWSSYGWFRSAHDQVSAETVIRPFLFAVTETRPKPHFWVVSAETEFRSVSTVFISHIFSLLFVEFCQWYCIMANNKSVQNVLSESQNVNTNYNNNLFNAALYRMAWVNQ